MEKTGYKVVAKENAKEVFANDPSRLELLK